MAHLPCGIFLRGPTAETMAKTDLSEPDLAEVPRSGRFEVWLALGLVAFGLIALPALIYFTGTLLLGAYGGGKHVGSFYGDFFSDLAGGSARAWALALGPLVLVQLTRLIFSRFSGKPDAQSAPPPVPQPAPRTGNPLRERREPTIKL